MVTNQIHAIGFEVSLMQHQWDVDVYPFHPPPPKKNEIKNKDEGLPWSHQMVDTWLSVLPWFIALHNRLACT